MARGLGTRMRAAGARGALTADQAAAAQRGDKALMPIDAMGERVLLDYVLSRAADAGITEVCLVVPPVHDGFLAHYQPSRLSRLRIDVAVQAQPTGTAHAVLRRGRGPTDMTVSWSTETTCIRSRHSGRSSNAKGQPLAPSPCDRWWVARWGCRASG